MDIDAVIAEATSVTAQPTAETKVEAPKDAEVNADAEAQVESDEIESTEETEAKVEEQFPKKAVNALGRKDKKIGKLSAKLEYEQQVRQQLEAELAKYRGNQQQEKPKDDGIPKEESFESYGDYVKALARYEAKQELAESNKKTQETQVSQQREAWKAEKESAVAQRAVEVMKQIPDYADLVEDNSDVLDAFENTHVEQAFLEADNGELAFYALAKEGKLQALLQLSPSRAAIEIAKAEERGRSYLKPQSKTTNAPAPITAARGNSSGSKALDRMSYQELVENLKIG